MFTGEQGSHEIDYLVYAPIDCSRYSQLISTDRTTCCARSFLKRVGQFFSTARNQLGQACAVYIPLALGPLACMCAYMRNVVLRLSNQWLFVLK